MLKTNEKKELDAKTLSTIEEQLNQEALIYKKYLAYSNQCYDSELKNLFYTSSKIHKENYSKLLDYLKS